MKLPNNLITQFVKATKDEKTPPKETVLFGTVRKIDGEMRVQLDGSDIFTPVESQAVLLDENDRVTVMIKNHTATVTGNLTNKAANIGQFNKLEAANITVQDTLTAQKAVIDSLDATYATIDTLTTDYMTAKDIKTDYMSANDIETDYLTADQIAADYATVGRVQAVEGDINNLNSEVANIDTLIFGSATGNVIQTSFSNAVIAQLGDAQVKSAMIESVSAGKITAGDIITNNVRVMSEDGSLIISDKMIQIYEGAEARIQIGKDKSGNYSIIICDQNGATMFSKDGITDAAIKEAIIRNDMVSDNANIHASKLDVDSLFEEINDDGSNTIKSTKVYLDEEGQTLDVVFKSLTTEVTDQGKIVSSQGTAISTIQGQISSKIWQQDINTAKNEMSTQYSTLEQDVNGFKMTVSKTYATIEDVDSISVGGRNYIIPSKIATYVDYTTIQSTDEDTISIAFKSDYDSSAAGSYLTLRVNGYTPPNEVMTLSGYIKVNGAIPKNNYFITRASTYGETEIVNSYDSSTGYFVCTQKYDGSSIWIIHAIVDRKSKAEDVVTFEKLKFEKGTLPTDWTPAPEDIDAEITNLDARILSAESSITQLTNKITANVTETTNLGTRTTTLEQTASGLTARLDDIHIGGRNLLRNSRLVQMYSNNTNAYPISCIQTTENGVTFYRVRRTDIENYPNTALSIYSTIPKSSFEYGEMAGKQVTLSFKARASHEVTSSFMDFTYGGDSVVDFGKPAEKITTKWKTYYVVIDSFPDMTNRTGVRWNPYNISLTSDILADFYIDICDYKFEFGNHPTDWSPAPEDVESDILDASKTATNYLEFSSSGLVIGDLTSSTLGKNVLIDSDSVDIRNGTTTLASFGADYLYLAKNSRNATIDLCNGLAKMYHQSRLSYDTLFVIETPNATEIRGTSDPLCVTSTVASKPAIKFANADGVLGSIGMVASGTESYITRNHPSTAATYSILDTGNYYKIMDSGWFNGGLLGDNFTVYNDNSQVKYRKIGKQVQIMGTVKPRVDIAGSTTQHTIFTLPSGYRPPYALHQVCYGSNNYTWRLTVNTNGTVCFSRYGLDSGYVTAEVGHWINFQATFFID